MELLVFYLRGQRYGLRVAVVQEVVRAVQMAPLPGAPPIVEGAIDYRGTVVPVLDVRSRFGHPVKPVEVSDFLIIARAAGRLVSLRADQVGWPVVVPERAIEGLAGTVGAARYVAGVGRLADGLVVIHDLETFLSGAESAELSSALAGATAGSA